MQSNTNITRLEMPCVFINEKEHISVKELLCSIIISTTTDVVAWQRIFVFVYHVQ